MKNNEELEEVKQIINIKRKKVIESGEAAIIFDGKQYSIRIPNKLARSAQIKLKKDKFLFVVSIPPINTGIEPTLTAKLIRSK
jgi:hypothetical protein